MRIVIFPKGNAVIIDGIGAPVDCSQLPACIHAVEWDSAYATGHIEYVNDRLAREIEYLPNEPLTDFSPYENFIDEWKTSHDAMVAKEAEEKERIAKEVAARDAKMIMRKPTKLNLTFSEPGNT